MVKNNIKIKTNNKKINKNLLSKIFFIGLLVSLAILVSAILLKTITLKLNNYQSDNTTNFNYSYNFSYNVTSEEFLKENSLSFKQLIKLFKKFGELKLNNNNFKHIYYLNNLADFLSFLGITILILIPVIGVFYTLFYYLRKRNLKITTITIIVILLLIISFLVGFFK